MLSEVVSQGQVIKIEKMSEEKLLTVRDVAAILGISEKEVLDLSENGSIPAYKVGGVYLRFRSDQIEAFRRSFKAAGGSSRSKITGEYSLREKISDFFYFNDFYILSALLILLILLIIFRGY